MTEKKRKSINSKRKGLGNERDIANLLSEYLDPLKFRKSENSGAIVGGKNFEILAQKFSKEALRLFIGDIVPLNESECNLKFRFVIEAKAYKDADKVHHLLNKESSIYKWMDEARINAKKLDLEPMLIFKWNNTPRMVCVENHIDIPTKYITLIDNTKITFLDDLLKYKNFWINI
jgi:hypothetical protein